MYFAKTGKSLTAQGKEIDRPMLQKGGFAMAEGTNSEDFSQALETANGVMNMYGRDLEFFKQKEGIERNSSLAKVWKRWTERKPIYINPDSKASELNASYSRVEDKTFGGVLVFNSYPNDYGQTIYTSQNEDIVSHETGHAFLDTILPDLYTQPRLQTQAIHESVGDLTCLFYQLSQKKNRLKVLEETKGNLHATSFLTLIAEPLNKGTKYGELRNLINEKRMGQTDCEEHDLSNIFSAAIYELLEELFKTFKILYRGEEEERILNRAQCALRLLLLRSLIEIPYSDPSFSDIGKQMEDLAKGWKAFEKTDFPKKIKEIFSNRDVNIIKPHTDDDDFCRINSQQPNQSLKSPFCTTFQSSLYQKSKWSFNFD